MFQTIINIPESVQKINYNHTILSMGSCFAENIGKRMKDIYFQIDTNPFGVLYNPISISNSLDLLLENKQFTANDLFESRGLWHSFSHSSLFSENSEENCLSAINERIKIAIEYLAKTDYLLITFGTAWVYEEQESGRVVSNCHKLPANQFKRRRLTVDQIVQDYLLLIEKLNKLLPHLTIVFSVSPIRHWKDGAHENNISKSTLMLAIDKLQNAYNNIHYFPSYEIQMDELRDYRFYAADMLHPSEVAIDYIWKRFTETFFEKNTITTKKEIEQLNADLSHRPMKPDSEEFKKFKLNIESKKQNLIADYPFLKDKF